MFSQHFLYQRLMAMTPLEVLYRLGQHARYRRDHIGAAGRIAAGGFIGSFILEDWRPANDARPELITAADRIKSGHIRCLALPDLNLTAPIDYHLDYQSGKRSPSHLPAWRINHHDTSSIGDIKYIWEPNRHQFLPVLAIAFRITGNQAYLHSIECYVAEWLEQNPYLNGVNWSSPLEMAIRLINWTIVWNLCGRYMSAELIKVWQESAFQQADFIHRHFSLYSSANNHLIGEAAGLYIACTGLLQGASSKEWRQKARVLLNREIIRQTFPDGVNREQSLAYQQFVLEFFLLSAGFGQQAGDVFPDQYFSYLEKMFEYLAAAGSKGEPFRHGDDDDGQVIDFQQSTPSSCRTLLNSGSFLFQRPDFFSTDDVNPGLDLRTSLIRFLFKEYPRPAFGAEKTPAAFPAGGRYFLGRNFGQSGEEKLMFDCGPLGYLSIAAHGHADALSFCYRINGYQFFIDPGTYTYHGEKKWRNYFRGTKAHNTVVIDSENQSRISGNFMWAHKANARCLNYQEAMQVCGEHDGYQILHDPVRHRRIISFDNDGIWTVIDDLTCQDKHQAEIMFHLHPDVILKESGKNRFILQRSGITLFLEMDSSLQCRIIRGQEDPPLGWYSPSFGKKVPCSVICGQAAIKGNHQSICRFYPDPLIRTRTADG